MLGLCFVSKYIVCKDDIFSAFRATKFMDENFDKCTRMTQGLHTMGLIVATIQRVLFWLQHEWD